MNWDAIGAIGEITGAVAVVVSFLFLSMQIRSSTRTERASANFQATHSWAEINDLVATLPDAFRTDLIRVFDPDVDNSSIPLDSRFRIHALYRSVFQRLEGQYFLYKYGLLEPGIWEKRVSWAARLVTDPFFDAWWKGEQDQTIFSDEFVSVVESAKSATVAQARNR